MQMQIQIQKHDLGDSSFAIDSVFGLPFSRIYTAMDRFAINYHGTFERPYEYSREF